MKRREFLGMAGAFAAAGCVSAKPAEAKWTPFRGTKKVRVVQWGLCHEHADGKFGSLKRLPNDFELVGVVDDRASKTAREARNYKMYDGVPRLTPEQVLADKSIQCVFVEVTNDDLISVAQACADRGLAMHLDKPCGQTLAPFVKVVETCRRRGIPLQIGYMFRVNPAVKFCQKAVAEKWIGDVNFVEADMNHNYGSKQYEPYIKSFKGGVLYNLGCHLVDFILPMFGDVVPCQAHAVLQTSAASTTPGTLSNTAALLAWKQGMALVRSCSKAPGGQRRLRIDGTKGCIDLCPIERFDGKNLTLRFSVEQDVPGYKKGTHTVDFGVQKDRYADQLHELAQIVRGDIPNPDLYDHDIAVHKATLMACNMPF